MDVITLLQEVASLMDMSRDADIEIRMLDEIRFTTDAKYAVDFLVYMMRQSFSNEEIVRVQRLLLDATLTEDYKIMFLRSLRLQYNKLIAADPDEDPFVVVEKNDIIKFDYFVVLLADMVEFRGTVLADIQDRFGKFAHSIAKNSPDKSLSTVSIADAQPLGRDAVFKLANAEWMVSAKYTDGQYTISFHNVASKEETSLSYGSDEEYVAACDFLLHTRSTDAGASIVAWIEAPLHYGCLPFRSVVVFKPATKKCVRVFIPFETYDYAFQKEKTAISLFPTVQEVFVSGDHACIVYSDLNRYLLDKSHPINQYLTKHPRRVVVGKSSVSWEVYLDMCSADENIRRSYRSEDVDKHRTLYAAGYVDESAKVGSVTVADRYRNAVLMLHAAPDNEVRRRRFLQVKLDKENVSVKPWRAQTDAEKSMHQWEPLFSTGYSIKASDEMRNRFKFKHTGYSKNANKAASSMLEDVFGEVLVYANLLPVDSENVCCIVQGTRKSGNNYYSTVTNSIIYFDKARGVFDVKVLNDEVHQEMVSIPFEHAATAINQDGDESESDDEDMNSDKDESEHSDEDSDYKDFSESETEEEGEQGTDAALPVDDDYEDSKMIAAEYGTKDDSEPEEAPDGDILVPVHVWSYLESKTINSDKKCTEFKRKYGSIGALHLDIDARVSDVATLDKKTYYIVYATGSGYLGVSEMCCSPPRYKNHTYEAIGINDNVEGSQSRSYVCRIRFQRLWKDEKSNVVHAELLLVSSRENVYLYSFQIPSRDTVRRSLFPLRIVSTAQNGAQALTLVNDVYSKKTEFLMLSKERVTLGTQKQSKLCAVNAQLAVRDLKQTILDDLQSTVTTKKRQAKSTATKLTGNIVEFFSGGCSFVYKTDDKLHLLHDDTIYPLKGSKGDSFTCLWDTPRNLMYKMGDNIKWREGLQLVDIKEPRKVLCACPFKKGVLLLVPVDEGEVYKVVRRDGNESTDTGIVYHCNLRVAKFNNNFQMASICRDGRESAYLIDEQLSALYYIDCDNQNLRQVTLPCKEWRTLDFTYGAKSALCLQKAAGEFLFLKFHDDEPYTAEFMYHMFLPEVSHRFTCNEGVMAFTTTETDENDSRQQRSILHCFNLQNAEPVRIKFDEHDHAVGYAMYFADERTIHVWDEPTPALAHLEDHLTVYKLESETVPMTGEHYTLYTSKTYDV